MALGINNDDKQVSATSIIGKFNPDFSLDRSKTETSPNFFKKYTGEPAFDPVKKIRDNLGIDNGAPTGTDPTEDVPTNTTPDPSQRLEDLINPELVSLPDFMPGNMDMGGGNNNNKKNNGMAARMGLIQGLKNAMNTVLPQLALFPGLNANGSVNNDMKTRNIVIIGLVAVVGLFGLIRFMGGSDAGGDMP